MESPFTIPNYRHGYCTDDNQNELLGIGRTHIVLPSADDSKEAPGSEDETGRLVLSKPLD